jgi:hypothetical protein
MPNEEPNYDKFQTRLVARKQMFNLIPTYCKKCKGTISLKFTDDHGSFTRLCWCGCEVYKYHAKDEFHETDFYTKNFISKEFHKKNYKKLNVLEQCGMKNNGNGKFTRG